MGGLGVLLQIFFFGLNDVKSCNFRHNGHGNANSLNPGMKARDSVYDDLGEEMTL